MRIGLNSLANDQPQQGAAVMRVTLGHRLYLLFEVVAVFVGIPLAYFLGLYPAHPIGTVVLVGLAMAGLLLLDNRFDRRMLGHPGDDLAAQLTNVTLLFLPTALLIAALVYWWNPSIFFYLPLQKTGLWLIILVAYPILSVYPQELIYRSFFFHRYRPLLGHGWPMIIASAVLFAFMHIIFRNWLAMAATLAGGILFAWRYHATRSLVVTSFEHALYGLLMFTVGLGAYFRQATAHLLDSLRI